MIKLDICSWCKHYTGLKDGWQQTCKAFPEGLPHPKEFEPKEGIECKNGISYEVNELRREEFMQIFHISDQGE